jgi:hypothetical protein
VPLPRNRHTWHDDGLPTFHSIQRQKLKAIPEGATNEAALVQKALKQTYERMDDEYGEIDQIDYRRIGAAMDKFLADHGVPSQ